MHEEMREHRARAADRIEARGLNPEEARGTALIDSLFGDIRFAFRTCKRSPTFAAGTIATIALAVGGATAIVSVVSAALLRPLPMRDDARVFRLQQLVARPDGGTTRVGLTQLNLTEILKRSRTIEYAVGHRNRALTLAGPTEPERVVAGQVSAGWLAAVGVTPVLGRGFTPEEETEDMPAHVVVIGYGFWTRHFANAPAAIGRTISLDGTPRTIVGVMPRGYAYPYDADLWLPYRLDPSAGDSRDLNVTARVRAGVTRAQLDAELRELASALKREVPANRLLGGIGARPIRSELVGDVSILYGLLGAVAFVLLVACVNIANLLLVRGAAREREFGIRAALGAGRGRQVRQLLTESLVLSLIGGLIGILLARAAVGALTPLIPDPLNQIIPRVEIDAPVLLAALGVCVATGLAFGIAPARRASRVDVMTTLKSSKTATSRSGSGPLPVLVVVQVAMAVVLVTGGGLLLRDLDRRLRSDIGVDARSVMTLNIGFPEERYRATAARQRFVRDLDARLHSLPGVVSTGMTTILPFGSGNMIAPVRLDAATPDARGTVNHRLVTPGLFPALGIRLLKGRLLDAHDDDAAAPVAVVSASMAARFWPNDDPIGKRLQQDGVAGAPMTTVVGVVNDVIQLGEMRETWYLPYEQGIRHLPISTQTLRIVVVARGRSDAANLTPSLRAAIHEIDPGLPLFYITPFEALVAESLSVARLSTTLVGCFALLGLLLAAFGIYGVVSYAASHRRHEIGVRIALGASVPHILSEIAGRAGVCVGIGIVLGLVGSIVASVLLRSVLVQTAPTDPLSLTLAVSILGIVGVLAAYIPARRAAGMSPLHALRSD